MDNTWWIEFDGLRLLIDPWLEGEEIDGWRWFNVQRHRTAPVGYRALPKYDAVLITQKYPDHLHEKTLRRLNPQCVLAPETTRKRLRRLLPASEIICFGTTSPSLNVSGVHFFWLPTRRRLGPIYDAIVLDSSRTSVLLATHGIDLDERHETILRRISPCRLVISPFNHFRLPTVLGGDVTPGLAGLRPLVERLDPDWVTQTHDEDKHAQGVVTRMAKIQRFAAADLVHYPWLAPKYLALNDYQEMQL